MIKKLINRIMGKKDSVTATKERVLAWACRTESYLSDAAANAADGKYGRVCTAMTDLRSDTELIVAVLDIEWEAHASIACSGVGLDKTDSNSIVAAIEAADTARYAVTEAIACDDNDIIKTCKDKVLAVYREASYTALAAAVMVGREGLRNSEDNK